MDIEGLVALAPFALLSLAVLIGMFVRLSKQYLFASIFTAKPLAKVGAVALIGAFWKVIADLINLKYDFAIGTGFGLMALLAGALVALVLSGNNGVDE
jgi:hypothetical protein